MKKIAALIMSVVMTVMCASMAFAMETVPAADGTQKAEASLTYGGEKVFDLSAIIGKDSDACQVADFLLESAENSSEIYLQLGQESLVIGSNGQYIEIQLSDLSAVLSEMMTGIMSQDSEVSAQLSQITEYLSSEDFSNDMQTISSVLSTELSKILLVANQSGLVTVADDGTVVIAGNIDTLVQIVSTVLQDLAVNDEAFTQLASTKLWTMAGLSSDGKNEQAVVAALAEQVQNIDASQFGGDISFKVVITADGNYELVYNEVTSGTTEEMHFITDNGTFNLTASVSQDGAEEYFALVYDGTKAIGEFKVDSEASQIDAEVELDTATLELNGTIASEGQTLVIAGGLDSEVSGENELAYKLTGTMDGTTAFEAAAGVRILASTETEQNYELYVQLNGTEYALDADITKADAGMGAALSLVVRQDDQEAVLGTFDFSYGAVDETIEHKTGEAVSKDDLTQVITSIVSQLTTTAGSEE